MKNYANKVFWAATADRAIRTICQTILALIGTAAIGITDVDWLQTFSVAALAGIVSVLTCLATPESITNNNSAGGGKD